MQYDVLSILISRNTIQAIDSFVSLLVRFLPMKLTNRSIDISWHSVHRQLHECYRRHRTRSAHPYHASTSNWIISIEAETVRRQCNDIHSELLCIRVIEEMLEKKYKLHRLMSNYYIHTNDICVWCMSFKFCPTTLFYTQINWSWKSKRVKKRIEFKFIRWRRNEIIKSLFVTVFGYACTMMMLNDHEKNIIIEIHQSI